MKIYEPVICWLIYLVVTGGLWYLLFDEASILKSLVMGGIIGLMGAGAYIYQHRKRPKK